MKTNTSKTLVCLVVVGVFLSPVAFAKEERNISAFKGKYNGTVTVVKPGGGGPESGTATVIIKVPKNGKSAIVGYTATISDGMNTTVLSTMLALRANKTLSVTDLLVGIAGTNNAKPGAGTWSQRKRKLTFSAADGDAHSLNGTASAKDLRKNRKLTLTLVSSDGVDSTTFTTTLRAKLPRQLRR